MVITTTTDNRSIHEYMNFIEQQNICNGSLYIEQMPRICMPVLLPVYRTERCNHTSANVSIHPRACTGITSKIIYNQGIYIRVLFCLILFRLLFLHFFLRKLGDNYYDQTLLWRYSAIIYHSFVIYLS